MNDNERLCDQQAKRTLRDLMDVAKLALGPGMPEPSQEDAAYLTAMLLLVVDKAMPLYQQAMDPRVQAAEAFMASARLEEKLGATRP